MTFDGLINVLSAGSLALGISTYVLRHVKNDILKFHNFWASPEEVMRSPRIEPRSDNAFWRCFDRINKTGFHFLLSA
jgi:hypothetical protein